MSDKLALIIQESGQVDRLVIELLGDSLPIGEMVDVGNSIYQQLQEGSDV